LKDVFKVLHDKETINKLLGSFTQYYSKVRAMEIEMIEENPYLVYN